MPVDEENQTEVAGQARRPCRILKYGANRFGESIPIHHKSTDLPVQIGTTHLALRRISYAEMYSGLQATLGRVIGGGFLGNKTLITSTLILDTKANEFLIASSPTGESTP